MKGPYQYYKSFAEIPDRLWEQKDVCNEKTYDVCLKTEKVGVGSEKFN